VQLTSAPRVVLLDEPTRGLDYAAKARLRAMLSELTAAGYAVVVATHDVEFVAQSAHRVVVLAEGEVVTSAPTLEALAASPVFAPQVAKILSPEPWLTVEQVAAALTGEAAFAVENGSADSGSPSARDRSSVPAGNGTA
jgi:ABC-type sulfate/molybdate transport systems ATPase subunit